MIGRVNYPTDPNKKKTESNLNDINSELARRLPLSGGTITGDLILQSGSSVHKAIADTNNEIIAGLFKIAQIVIKSTSVDVPIIFELIHRGAKQPMIVSIKFENTSSSIDPELEHIIYYGENYGAYIYKSSRSTWDLYIKKSEAQDSVTVTQLQKDQSWSNDIVEVIWKDDVVSTKPEDSIEATLHYISSTSIESNNLDITELNNIAILDYIKSNYREMNNYIFKGTNCTQSPLNNETNSFIYTVSTINDSRYLRVIAYDTLENKSYSNALIEDNWTGWNCILDQKNYMEYIDLSEIGALSQESFNNFQIGGRNLARGTSNTYTQITHNGEMNTSSVLARVYTNGLKVGDIVTVRLLYKYTNLIASELEECKIVLQGSGNITGLNDGTFNSSEFINLTGSGEYEFLYSFEITQAHLENEYWIVEIRHDNIKSGTSAWKMFKVERGTKPSDWTPAPEDLALVQHTHSPSDIIQDSENRFVSDEKISNWDDHLSNTSNPHNVTTEQIGAVAISEKGVSNGVATLDSTGKVPSTQLPSYVDDILEYDDESQFPEVGESGKLYLDKTTGKIYRWAGTSYAIIPDSLTLGETENTAYPGNKGKIAYDHTFDTSNPHNVTTEQIGAISISQKGVANGVATLDSTGKVPSTQLPSYVDDILEYDDESQFPEVGESGKIYTDISTGKIYRWSGSTYTIISDTIALGETESTAYRGDRGKVAYDHTFDTSNPHNVTAEQIGALKQVDFDNFEIGGRNLLTNTVTFVGWRKADTSSVINTYNGFTLYENTYVNNGTYNDLGLDNIIEIEPSTTYILSFWAKGEGNIRSFFYPNIIEKTEHCNGTIAYSDDGNIVTTLTDQWTRYWIRWTTKHNASGLKSIIVCRQQTESTVSIYAPKLEKGTKPSDWTPSPEDILYKSNVVNDLTTTLDGYVLDARVAKTLDDKKLDKTGGTISGNLVLEKGFIVSNTNQDGAGSAGYIKVATITISATHMNSPINFVISRRNSAQLTNVFIVFKNASNTDPELNYFTYYGSDIGVYIHKSATSTWDLYIKKSESYDNISIHDIKYNSGYMKGINITTSSVFTSTLPDGYVSVTFALNASYASSSGKWSVERNVTINGDYQGSFSLDGTKDISFNLHNKYSIAVAKNSTNYIYHRIAKLDKVNQNHRDDAVVIKITQDYYNRFALFRVRVRRNGTGQNSACIIQWITSVGYKEDDLCIGFSNEYDNTYADIFLKVREQYDNAIISIFSSSYREDVGSNWILINSSESNNTTTTDKLDSYECWRSVEEAATELHGEAYNEIKTATSAGSVNFSNYSRILSLLSDPRPADANVDFSTFTQRGITTMLASSNMTSNKPYADGIIMNIGWDCGNYGAQLYINTDSTKHTSSIQYRKSGEAINNWSRWKTLLDDGNFAEFITPDSIKALSQESFNNFQIGGRNLARGTSKSYRSEFTHNGGTNICVLIAYVYNEGLKLGDTITVRLLYKYTDIVSESGGTARVRIQGMGNVSGWSNGAFNSSEFVNLTGSGEYEFLYSFKITQAQLENGHWEVKLRHDYIASGTSTWKMFKVERGTKPSDWTPAPEDLALSSHTHKATDIIQDSNNRFVTDTDKSNWDNHVANKSNPHGVTVSQIGAISISQKGVANGVATLDSTGKVPSTQLPSYVDDILEYDNMSSFPSTGESGKIYTDISTGKIYRWSGSTYTIISDTLALGETSSTAYRGDRGKIAYDHTNNKSNPHGVTIEQIGAASSSHTHNYLPLSGGTMTGNINTSYVTESFLNGNKGKALINSLSAAGSYTTLHRYQSTNGFFTISGYLNTYRLQYTSKTTVDANTNAVDKSIILLDESGNSSFPGTVSASSFSGSLSGNASSASKVNNALTISLNGASQGAYDGSSTKSINITPSSIGAAASSHTHTKSQITDFPASLKNPSALTISLNGASQGAYDGSSTKSINITPSSIGAAAASHTHTKSQITDFPTSLKNPSALTISLNGASQGAYDGSSTKSINITPSSIGAAASSHTHDINGLTNKGATINASFATAYRTQTKGNTSAGDYIRVLRNDTANVANSPQHGSGIAWGRVDTHGYMYMSYNSAEMYVGAGNADKLNWIKKVSLDGHTHSYLPLSGGTMTGIISTSFATNTHLLGNTTGSLINSTTTAGSYVMLHKYPSTNGYFTLGGWSNSYRLFYTAKSTVDAGTNSYSKMAVLLDEGGNSSFPGIVAASSFSGSLSGNASSASKVNNAITISLNGASQGAYDGSAAKSINITPSSIGAAAASHTHSPSNIVQDANNRFVTDTEKSTWNSKAAGNHTHNYAGSSSAGGSANSAIKLATARTINGISFDGTANISVPNNTYTRLTTGSLDYVKALGNYYADSHSVTNLPGSSGETFTLIVAKHYSNGIIQLYYSASTVAFRMFKYDAPAWSSWIELAIYNTNAYARLGAAAASHTHTKSQITDFPASLKNPSALTISLNGTSQGAYDGSSAKSINITPSSIGAAASSHTHSYLPLSGGTVSGNVTVKGDIITNGANIYLGTNYSGQKKIYFYSYPKTTSGSKATHQIRLYGGAPDSDTAFGLYDAYASLVVFAYEDGNTSSGTTGGTKKFKINSSVTFSATGSISSSDEKLKHDFGTLEKYEEWYYDLEPCTFKYNNGNSGRTWIGLGARKTKQKLLEHGLSLKEFAGITIENKSPNSDDWRGVPDEHGIRYEQFIMLNTHMIQKHKKEIDSLRDQLQEQNKQIEQQQEQIEKQNEQLQSQQREIDKLKEAVEFLMKELKK